MGITIETETMANRLRIFLVCIETSKDVYDMARRLMLEAGAQNYADADEFLPDGVRDPYRAITESDAVIWIYQQRDGPIQYPYSFYNYLHGDGVMQRAIDMRKTVLFYSLTSHIDLPVPSIMRFVARRRFGLDSVPELESVLRDDLHDLMTGDIRPEEQAEFPAHGIKPATLRVFLCHSKLDKTVVRGLYGRLMKTNVRPWFDEESLTGGEDWELAIENAVRASHVILVLLSRKSVTTPGFAQKEIRLALDVADCQPEGSSAVIPVRLEDCEIPRRLQSKHWINLFEEDGFQKLMRALKQRAVALQIRLTEND
jgi:hypothetical protein